MHGCAAAALLRSSLVKLSSVVAVSHSLQHERTCYGGAARRDGSAGGMYVRARACVCVRGIVDVFMHFPGTTRHLARNCVVLRMAHGSCVCVPAPWLTLTLTLTHSVAIRLPCGSCARRRFPSPFGATCPMEGETAARPPGTLCNCCRSAY